MSERNYTMLFIGFLATFLVVLFAVSASAVQMFPTVCCEGRYVAVACANGTAIAILLLAEWCWRVHAYEFFLVEGEGEGVRIPSDEETPTIVVRPLEDDDNNNNSKSDRGDENPEVARLIAAIHQLVKEEQQQKQLSPYPTLRNYIMFWTRVAQLLILGYAAFPNIVLFCQMEQCVSCMRMMSNATLANAPATVDSAEDEPAKGLFPGITFAISFVLPLVGAAVYVCWSNRRKN
jgi:hypothetical protein